MQKQISTQYNDIHHQYSTKATEQDKVGDHLFHESLNLLPLEGMKVLDIGCGDGRDLALLMSRGIEAWGVDPSDAFLEKARSNNPNAEFVQANGESLPFPNKPFGFKFLRIS